jgi:hypothetical protein
MEDLDEIAILDALSVFLSAIAWTIRWILVPYTAIWASLNIEISINFFYVSTLLFAFLYGLSICSSGSKRHIVLGIFVIVLCASVLSARMEAHIENTVRDEGWELKECYMGWDEYQTELVRVHGELRACKGKIAACEDEAICHAGSWCRNPAAEFVEGV